LARLRENSRIPRPSPDFPEIRVLHFHGLSELVKKQGHEELLYRFKDYKITRKEIDENFENIVMTVRPNWAMQRILDGFQNLNGGTLIYSQWSGYKKEEKTKNFIDSLAAQGVTVKDIHTSGHADLAGLKQMVKTLQPKNLVPIHTFEGDEYEKLFTGTNVVMVNDREEVAI
jgi:ribonuclease J